MGDRSPFAIPKDYNTALDPMAELQFRQFLSDNKVPFNPDAGATDYDMRGFWQARQQGHPLARSAVNPNDQRMHYPDYWKTPSHETFSAESQWAKPGAPQWINDRQLASPSGKILHDEGATQDMVRALLK